MKTPIITKQLYTDFDFHPRPWWDPVPDWFRERLNPEQVEGFTKIQLAKQRRVLEAEMESLAQVEILLKIR